MKKSHKFSLYILLLLIFQYNVYCQSSDVNISINVVPPFSSHISDYTENPDKVVVNLYYNGTNPEGIDIYLHGQITGETGISVYTDPNYKPATSIHLQNAIPYKLTADELSNLYSQENILSEGISIDEISTSGLLPEDYYQICIQAYNFDTDEQVSADQPLGCSNYFQITNSNPPIITSPYCESNINPQTPQNIYINWTIPEGVNPVYITYLFRIIEIPVSSGIDPVDAVNDASFPSLYEEELSVNSIILSEDKALLSEGNIYACTVQAKSLGDLYYFNNDGVSEVCWFNYSQDNENSNAEDSGIDLISSLDIFQEQFELIPKTIVNGRLFYKLPENGQQTMALEGFDPLNQNQETSSINENQTYNYIDLSNTELHFNGNANTYHIGFNAINAYESPPNMQAKPPYGKGLLHKQTENIDKNKPLANTRVRLVARIGILSADGFPTFVSNPYGLITGRGKVGLNGYGVPQLVDVEGNAVYNPKGVLNVQLAETTTDTNGNYSFDFTQDFFTAACQIIDVNGSIDLSETITNPVDEIISNQIDDIINWGNVYQGTTLWQGQNPQGQTMSTMSGHLNTSIGFKDAYICLKVEVVNPKFCAPDVDIFAMPGDQIELGDQVVKIKTYNANIISKSDNTIPQLNHANQPLKNTQIKIYRDEQSINREHPLIIKEEGQQLNTYSFNDIGKFKNIVIDKTGLNGNVVLKNLVKHWENNSIKESPYYISLQTRKDSLSIEYENTFYNYKKKFEDLETTFFNYAKIQNTPITINHNYHVPTVEYTYIMSPNPPEIKARVVAESNMETVGLKNTSVILFTQNTYLKSISIEDSTIANIDSFEDFKSYYWLQTGMLNFNIERATQTNEASFFKFTGLNINQDDDNVIGPYRRIMLIKEGYKTKIINSFNKKPFNVNNGELLDLKTIILEPRNYLEGRVVNEEGIPIKAYVRLLEDGPFYKTITNTSNNDQEFSIAARTNGNKIKIEPLSSQYFEKEFDHININEERQTFVVYKRLHRFRLKLTDKLLGGAVANASVVIADSLSYGKTNSYGVLDLKFASPANQFIIKITKEGYAPYQSILTLGVSEKWVIREIELTDSFYRSGTITDAQTNEKIAHAHVYAELSNTDGHQLIIEAYTNEYGDYTLYGIPTDCTSLELHISKEGNNPSYIGKVVQINVSPNNLVRYDFTLQPVTGWDITNLLGFPMQVEKFIPKANPNQAIISGYLYNMPTRLGFSLQENSTKTYFSSILVEKNEAGKITPVANVVNLNTIQIPLKINNTFLGMMEEPKQGNQTISNKLKLYKTGDYALIKSAVKLDLASFRYAYKFDGNFYVGDDLNHYTATVFNSKPIGMQLNRRRIFDVRFDPKYQHTFIPIPIKDYTLFEFNADSDIEDSYIQNGKISLKTILHTELPLGANKSLDLKLPIGNIQIFKNNIFIEESSTEEMAFKLEEWDVIAKKGWKFDKNEEAILLPETLINSKKGFSATVTDMRVRADALRDGDVAIQGGLNLGGIADLEIAQGLKPKFNYDSGLGHYTISLTGNSTTDEPIAKVSNLPETSDDLEFENIILISNDEEALTLNQEITFYNILKLNVNQIMTGNGFFSLKGSPDLGIPNLIASNAIINFSKKNNHLQAELEPLQAKVDCSSNVIYHLTNGQHIETNLFTSEGYLRVSPSANDSGKDDDSFKLDGKLTRVLNDTTNVAVHPQFFKLGEKKLNVTKGKIKVVDNLWKELNYTTKPDAEDTKGLDENNTINFTVTGNISTNSDDIKVNEEYMQGGAKTGFGSLIMVYNFEEASLTGTISLDPPAPILLGPVLLNYGLIQTRFDPSGFYLLATANMTFPTPVNNVDGGILLGFTSLDLNHNVYPLLSQFRTEKPDFSKGLKGIYVIVQRNIIDKTINLIPEVLDFTAIVSIGAYLNINFVENPTFILGGYGYAECKGSVDLLACTLGTYANFYLGLESGYDASGFYFEVCGSGNIGAHACNYNVSESFYARFGSRIPQYIQYGIGNVTCFK
jgi:TANFOR domain-containing protein